MLGPFACARFRFVLEATTPLRLSAVAGAALRGGFGYVFKRAVCLWPPGDCPRCLLKTTCAYPYIFETAPPPGTAKLRGLDQVPRPFVVEPPDDGRTAYRPGEAFAFRLVLVGRAIDLLPYFVFAFRQLGETGLGPGRGRYRLAEVHEEGPRGERLLYAAADGTLRPPAERVTAADLAGGVPEGRRLAVEFRTPTRITSGAALRRDVSFTDLVRALLRRLSSLCYFHCAGELSLDFPGLVERACSIRTVESGLVWQEQERFSTRQEQRIEMGGVVGRVVYEAADAAALAPYRPLLAAGEWVHVGKGTVMGLGKYRAESG
jgi:hypothetical protein